MTTNLKNFILFSVNTSDAAKKQIIQILIPSFNSHKISAVTNHQKTKNHHPELSEQRNDPCLENHISVH